MLSQAEIEFLGRVPLFAALSASAMERLGKMAKRVDIDGAAMIFQEGEPAKELVVVLRGELEVRKRGNSGGDARIATLRPGDVAGEMSLIDIQPRSAGVRAIGAATLVTLSHGDLATLHREDPASYTLLVMNIAREISRRLRRVDALLANLMIDVQDVWRTTMDAQEKVS
jgi:CRP-like cAMP-binding protein